MPDPAGSRGLVLDTSVWINFLATEALLEILAALAVPCHAPEQVLARLRGFDPCRGDFTIFRRWK